MSFYGWRCLHNDENESRRAISLNGEFYALNLSPELLFFCWSISSWAKFVPFVCYTVNTLMPQPELSIDNLLMLTVDCRQRIITRIISCDNGSIDQSRATRIRLHRRTNSFVNSGLEIASFTSMLVTGYKQRSAMIIKCIYMYIIPMYRCFL